MSRTLETLRACEEQLQFARGQISAKEKYIMNSDQELSERQCELERKETAIKQSAFDLRQEEERHRNTLAEVYFYLNSFSSIFFNLLILTAE